MKWNLAFAILAAFSCATLRVANTRLKIDTIPAEYAPSNEPTIRGPVSLSSYHFEVNPTNNRARLVVLYSYPDEMTYGPDDDSGGPRPTVVQLPGLTYDSKAHAVIYEGNGRKSVCATVNDKRTELSGNRLKIRNTGDCTISTARTLLTIDDGWTTHRESALETYFEAR